MVAIFKKSVIFASLMFVSGLAEEVRAFCNGSLRR